MQSVICFLLLLNFSSNEALIVSVFQPVMTQRNPSKAEQLTRLETALSDAAVANSSLLLLPELFLTGYSLDSGLRAEPRGGSSYEVAQNLALKYNVSVVFTYPELGENGAVYDSAALLHRSGRSLIDYRKVNLASGEDAVFTAGESFSPVIEVEPGVRAGLLICFDIFLPEPARILALNEANLILVPTANGYPNDYNPLARVIVPSRALENNAFVAYTNWVQSSDRFGPFTSFHGQTSVSDPGANLLYIGPPDSEEIVHLEMNFTGVIGSTAINRPAPDYQDGLCSNVTQ